MIENWIFHEFCKQDFGEVCGTVAGLVETSKYKKNTKWAYGKFAQVLYDRMRVRGQGNAIRLQNMMIEKALDDKLVRAVWKICHSEIKEHIKIARHSKCGDRILDPSPGMYHPGTRSDIPPKQSKEAVYLKGCVSRKPRAASKVQGLPVAKEQGHHIEVIR